MYCSKCGVQVADTANFCSSCGQHLVRPHTPTPIAAPSGESSIQSATTNPISASSEKPKRPLLTRIFLVFLWFGVVTNTVAFVLLTLGGSPERYRLGMGMFFGVGFLSAIYAKKYNFIWFFVGGFCAIAILGGLDGVLRRLMVS